MPPISVTEPHRRGLHRRAPCSRVHLAYSLRQLCVGILPPYTLNPYNQSRNVLQTPQIYIFYSYCLRPIIILIIYIKKYTPHIPINISRDGGSGYRTYVFKESTRHCAIDYKGQGHKEVIYLHVTDVSCTQSVYKSTGLSYRGSCGGVL